MLVCWQLIFFFYKGPIPAAPWNESIQVPSACKVVLRAPSAETGSASNPQEHSIIHTDARLLIRTVAYKPQLSIK